MHKMKKWKVDTKRTQKNHKKDTQKKLLTGKAPRQE